MDVWSFGVDTYGAEFYYDEGFNHAELLNSSSVQLDELNMVIGSIDSTSQTQSESSLPFINRSSSTDSNSSNYMMIGHMASTSLTMPTEDIAITRALLSAMSSSPASSHSSATSYMQQSHLQVQIMHSQEHCKHQPMSGFQPYNSLIHPTMVSKKNLVSQHMIKGAHSMLRYVNMLKTQEKMEGLAPSGHQKQNLVSERRRRERLNAGFHSLWQLLPPGSKKDKTSVLCKTMSYMKTLKAEIYELEKKNRFIEEQLLSSIKVKKQYYFYPNEKIEVEVSKYEETFEAKLIDLVIKVKVQCDLHRVLLRVLECIKDMEATNLLWLDASPSSQEMNLLTTLKLAIKRSTWDERNLKETITKAALMAVTN